MEKGIQGAQTTSIIGSLSLYIYIYIYMQFYLYKQVSKRGLAFSSNNLLGYAILYIYLFTYLFTHLEKGPNGLKRHQPMGTVPKPATT
jgi:hypothetical protein